MKDVEEIFIYMNIHTHLFPCGISESHTRLPKTAELIITTQMFLLVMKST